MSIVCINLNIQHVNGMTYFEYLLSFDFSLFPVFWVSRWVCIKALDNLESHPIQRIVNVYRDGGHLSVSETHEISILLSLAPALLSRYGGQLFTPMELRRKEFHRLSFRFHRLHLRSRSSGRKKKVWSHLSLAIFGATFIIVAVASVNARGSPFFFIKRLSICAGKRSSTEC